MNSKKIDTIVKYLNLVVLLAFSIQIAHAPGIKMLIWVLAMWGYIYVNRKQSLWDVEALLLLVGMGTYAIVFGHYYANDFTKMELIKLGIVPFLAYIGGKVLVALQDKEQLNKWLKCLVLILSFGITIHATLNYFKYLETGFFIESGKRWLDYWVEVPLFATEHSFYGAIMAGLLFYGCYEMLQKRINGFFVVLGVIWVNYINIQVVNRMVLGITGAVFILSIFIYLFLVRKDKRKIKRFCFVLLGIIIFLAIIWLLNIGGFKETSYYEALLHRDGGIIKNVRFQIQWNAIKQLPSAWKGGLQISSMGYTNLHNFWLQVANETGIVPFLCIVGYTVLSIIDTIKILNKEELDISVRILLPSAYAGMLGYFSMEQGGHGTADFIMYLMLLGGIISQTRKCLEAQEKNECSTDGK